MFFGWPAPKAGKVWRKKGKNGESKLVMIAIQYSLQGVLLCSMRTGAHWSGIEKKSDFDREYVPELSQSYKF